jgi:hypothetical protein
METWDEIKKEIETNENLNWEQVRVWVKELSDVERGKMLVDTSKQVDDRVEEQVALLEVYKDPKIMEDLKKEQITRMEELNKK